MFVRISICQSHREELSIYFLTNYSETICVLFKEGKPSTFIFYLEDQVFEVIATSQFLWEWISNCSDSGLKPLLRQ
jgi:hypothetical protein